MAETIRLGIALGELGEKVDRGLRNWNALIDATIAVTADTDHQQILVGNSRIIIRNGAIPDLNNCYLRDPDSTVVSGALEHFVRILDTRGLPGSIVFPSFIEDVVAPVVQGFGFAVSEPMRYMIRPLQEPVIVPLKDGQVETPGTFERVSSLRALGESVAIQESAFGMQPGSLSDSMGQRVLSLPNVWIYNFRDIYGTAVSTGVAVLDVSGELATILRVSRLPEEEYREKGCGARVFGALLRDCRREGVQVAQLRASVDGASLYERTGFVDVELHRSMVRLQVV